MSNVRVAAVESLLIWQKLFLKKLVTSDKSWLSFLEVSHSLKDSSLESREQDERLSVVRSPNFSDPLLAKNGQVFRSYKEALLAGFFSRSISSNCLS